MSPVGYWHVDQIKQSLRQLLDSGTQPQQEITDVGAGNLIAAVRDADRNVIGLIQSA